VSQIYFYWNKEYAACILRHNSKVPAFDINGKEFSPNEIRSLRNVEVILLPANEKEFDSMRSFVTACFNPYGVVCVVKKPVMAWECDSEYEKQQMGSGY